MIFYVEFSKKKKFFSLFSPLKLIKANVRWGREGVHVKRTGTDKGKGDQKLEVLSERTVWMTSFKHSTVVWPTFYELKNFPVNNCLKISCSSSSKTCRKLALLSAPISIPSNEAKKMASNKSTFIATKHVQSVLKLK